MENQPPSLHRTHHLPRAEIDTTRPFRSVREAVAVFGERFLASDIYIQKPPSILKHETSAPHKIDISSPTQLNQAEEEDRVLANLVKRLEAELEETKHELMQLKARESETEIALASLNAELHKSMSRMAEAEAAEAARAAAKSRLIVGEFERDGGGKEECGVMKLERSPSLAQILSIGEKEGYFRMQKERKVMKKKPIVPLIGDMFSRKRGSFCLYNPLYGRSHAY